MRKSEYFTLRNAVTNKFSGLMTRLTIYTVASVIIAIWSITTFFVVYTPALAIEAKVLLIGVGIASIGLAILLGRWMTELKEATDNALKILNSDLKNGTDYETASEKLFTELYDKKVEVMNEEALPV